MLEPESLDVIDPLECSNERMDVRSDSVFKPKEMGVEVQSTCAVKSACGCHCASELANAELGSYEEIIWGTKPHVECKSLLA